MDERGGFKEKWRKEDERREKKREEIERNVTKELRKVTKELISRRRREEQYGGE